MVCLKCVIRPTLRYQRMTATYATLKGFKVMRICMLPETVGTGEIRLVKSDLMLRREQLKKMVFWADSKLLQRRHPQNWLAEKQKPCQDIPSMLARKVVCRLRCDAEAC